MHVLCYHTRQLQQRELARVKLRDEASANYTGIHYHYILQFILIVLSNLITHTCIQRCSSLQS
jgi:hypothetical protein